MQLLPPSLLKRLEQLDSKHLRRTLKTPAGIDFSSNDYLGFAHDPVLRARIAGRVKSLPNGSGASRLLRGEQAYFGELEQELASFSHHPEAIVMPSGYQANVGLFSALLQSGDVVFSDALNHASIIDGTRLSKAERVVFAHNDMSDLRAKLHASKPAGIKVIATESVFSMDGDFSPLAEIVALAQEFGALVVVDEAHATGLFGEGAGRVVELGLEKDVFATLHTGGKALGSAGAWITGPSLLRNYLANFSRAFIFSTGTAPTLAASLAEACAHLREVGQERREALWRNAGIILSGLQATLPPEVARWLPPATAKTPVVPVVLGSEQRALAVAAQLQQDGFDVRAVRPPTVPAGTSRLRITLHSTLSSRDCESLVASVGRAVEAHPS